VPRPKRTMIANDSQWTGREPCRASRTRRSARPMRRWRPRRKHRCPPLERDEKEEEREISAISCINSRLYPETRGRIEPGPVVCWIFQRRLCAMSRRGGPQSTRSGSVCARLDVAVDDVADRVARYSALSSRRAIAYWDAPVGLRIRCPRADPHREVIAALTPCQLGERRLPRPLAAGDDWSISHRAETKWAIRANRRWRVGRVRRRSSRCEHSTCDPPNWPGGANACTTASVIATRQGRVAIRRSDESGNRRPGLRHRS